jgi:hypothetical protein
VKFAVWADRKIDDLLHGEQVEVNAQHRFQRAC